QRRAIAKDAALGVVARFNEFHRFASRQDFRAAVTEPLQVFVRQKASALVSPDEFLDGVLAVAGDGRKNLLRNGENASARLVREAVVEDSDFTRARSEERRVGKEWRTWGGAADFK